MISPSQLQVLAASEATVRPPVAPFVQRPRRRLRSISDVVIRLARPRDDSAIHDLQALDGRVLADGVRLVAEVDGVIVAAISVGDGVVVADPFECTMNATALLRMRARQLRGQPATPRLTLIQRLAR